MSETDDTTAERAPSDEPPTDPDVIVVGGGVSGLMAATFTARAGLETLVIDDGESILRRNAHLENVPGFPAGVNARLFLDLLAEQAGANGAAFLEGRVTDIDPDEDAHAVRVERTDDETVRDCVVCGGHVYADDWHLVVGVLDTDGGRQRHHHCSGDCLTEWLKLMTAA